MALLIHFLEILFQGGYFHQILDFFQLVGFDLVSDTFWLLPLALRRDIFLLLDIDHRRRALVRRGRYVFVRFAVQVDHMRRIGRVLVARLRGVVVLLFGRVIGGHRIEPRGGAEHVGAALHGVVVAVDLNVRLLQIASRFLDVGPLLVIIVPRSFRAGVGCLLRPRYLSKWAYILEVELVYHHYLRAECSGADFGHRQAIFWAV